MFVTQVIVMLSRTSSRVRLPTGLPSKALRDVLEAVGVVVEHPGGEGDGRIGEPVQRLRAIPHLERVADALREEEAQPVVGALLVGRQTGRRRVAGPEDVRCERLGYVGRDGAGHVGVDAEQLRRGLGADHVGDLRAPVTALCDEPRVSQAPHQHDPGVRDVDGAPAGRRRLAGVPVAGHRGDHDVEGVLGVAAVAPSGR